MTRIELRQLEEGKTELLVMEVKHINGVYRLTVNRKTISTRNGFICEEWIPFQDGNFNFTVTTGRKSQKKLDTLNKIIEDNKQELFNLWRNGKHNELCQTVLFKAQDLKVA